MGPAFARLVKFVNHHALVLFLIFVCGSTSFVLRKQWDANQQLRSIQRNGTIGNCIDLNKFRDGMLSLVDDRSPQRVAAELVLADRTATAATKKRAAVTIDNLDKTLELLQTHLPVRKCGTPASKPSTSTTTVAASTTTVCTEPRGCCLADCVLEPSTTLKGTP